ncbi:MAG: Coenzyme F420 hydrogenase/dehydrogenase, beta subunit C-terminal domain [Oscillospiraceae bacterium]|nr:Coenzyme F420 hydrogenase/dehydrogenase, beta subunit C-terminal domain [Oscillospiraceae bacterium]
MIQVISKENCNGCKGCFTVCSKNCITMQSDNEGFWYPKIDVKTCINCEMCEKVCPELNVKEVLPKTYQPSVYAAWNKNEVIRMSSSSGGVFTALSEVIIKNEGVVFGAGFGVENLEVMHQKIDNVSDLHKLRGSKYVQSDIGRTYQEVKELLGVGKQVLFSGTPCQIGGLYSFLLMVKYDNLYTCDIICHGVPSPAVFEKYKNHLKKLHGHISDITFRDKDTGWKSYSFSYSSGNKKLYSEQYRDNAYMKGFLRDLYLRPSCSNCSFKGVNRQADITLADFWGVASKYPELDDDKGTSLLLIHSKKGDELLSYCGSQIELYKADLDHAIKHNSCAIKSVMPNRNRAKFFEELTKDKEEKYPINQIIEKYSQYSFYIRVKIKAREGVSKLKNKIWRDSM